MNTPRISVWTERVRAALWFSVLVLMVLTISATRVAACSGGGVDCATYPNPFVLPCSATYYNGTGPWCGNTYQGSYYKACCNVGSSSCCNYTCSTYYCYPYPPYSSCPQATYCGYGSKSTPAVCDTGWGVCVQKDEWGYG
jgi:hypothetical protein